MDIALVCIYLIMIRVSVLAVAPAIAFLLTVLISDIEMGMVLQHSLFIVVYTVCALTASYKIGYAMLTSAVVNCLCVAYFIFPVYLDNYEGYFLYSMTVVNLVIILTILKGVTDGDSYRINTPLFTRLFNLYNLQTHTKTGQR
jgi:hypothetical protein